MRFGVFYELQLPKPWAQDSEHKLIQEAIAQVQLADRIGIDYAWAVEHHFLDEYSHCSASEVFLTALAAKTERIRIGFGIRQVIPHYNHPSRTAEAVAMLDLISSGRVEFGIVQGSRGDQALQVRLLDPVTSVSKSQSQARRKDPEAMAVIVEDLIKMLDKIGEGYRHGRHPDNKVSKPAAQVLRAVASELEL